MWSSFHNAERTFVFCRKAETVHLLDQSTQSVRIPFHAKRNWSQSLTHFCWVGNHRSQQAQLELLALLVVSLEEKRGDAQNGCMINAEVNGGIVEATK